MPAAGNTEEIHKITTGLVSFGMTALTLLIIVYGNGLHLIDYIATICFILISAFTAYVVLFKKLKHYTFTIEVTYCVLFVVALTIIAHS
jgi:phosphatidylserine synthase